MVWRWGVGWGILYGVVAQQNTTYRMHSYFKHFTAAFVLQVSCKIPTSTSITCTNIKRLQRTTSFIFQRSSYHLTSPFSTTQESCHSLPKIYTEFSTSNNPYHSLPLFPPKKHNIPFYTPAPSIPNPYITQNTMPPFFPFRKTHASGGSPTSM